MPAPSKVLTLPRAVRERLDALIVEHGFSGYGELADWITAQGHPMHTATVARHGQALKRRIEQVRLATEQAEALVAAAPDDTGAMSEGALRQVQARIFEMMLAAEGGDLKELAATARALAETARASLAVRADRRKVLKEAAQAADKVAVRAGLSADTAAAIRSAIERAGAAS